MGKLAGMLVAAAVCPCPPLLVPEVARGAAHELDALRAACSDALAILAASCPDRLIVVGYAGEAGLEPFAEGTVGSFRGFGVDVRVRLGSPADEAGGSGAGGPRELPLSLAVGAWLLARTEWGAAPVEGLGVGERLGTERCLAVGRELAERAGRVALLVMGDGSACRTVKAPGYFDERAAAFDAEAARALGAADSAALAALDAGPAYELKAAGRSGWQVLAGAGEQRTRLGGELIYEDAPYGVGYLVAAWS